MESKNTAAVAGLQPSGAGNASHSQQKDTFRVPGGVTEPFRLLHGRGFDFGRRTNVWLIDEVSFAYISGRQVIVQRIRPRPVTASPGVDLENQYLTKFQSSGLKKEPVFLRVRQPACEERQSLAGVQTVTESFILHYCDGDGGGGGISTLAVDSAHGLLAVCECSNFTSPCKPETQTSRSVLATGLSLRRNTGMRALA